MLRDGVVVIRGCASAQWLTNKIDTDCGQGNFTEIVACPALTSHARPNQGHVAEPVFEALRRLNSKFSRSCKLIVYSVMNQSSSLIKSYEMA